MKQYGVLLLILLALALTGCQASPAAAGTFQPEAQRQAAQQEPAADRPESGFARQEPAADQPESGSDRQEPAADQPQSDSELGPAAAPTVGSVVITNSTAVPGPVETPAAALPPSPTLEQLAEQARQELAGQLNIDLARVELDKIVPAKWPYDGLGCPLPEAGSVDESTPGYQILLKANGQVFTYHTDGTGWIGLCEIKPRDEIRTLP